MKQSEVLLSRRAADVVNLLAGQARRDFIEAVMLATSISGVARPYRDWLNDSASIPADARRQRPIGA